MARENIPKIVLYSCTFLKDLNRTIRMVESVAKHNKGRIPFYISVPEEEVGLFVGALSGKDVTVFNEQDILRANPKLPMARLYEISGSIRQQIIKSEFWRLGLCENYIVLDSDCVFIRDFDETDFIATEDIPYSVIHEGRDLLLPTEKFGPPRTRRNFIEMAERIKKALGRQGVTYHFGWAPFLWSRKVWESLDKNYLTPGGETLLDAILYSGSELTWYGESLLAFRAIPIYPRDHLFRHYNYEHQFWLDRALGYSEQVLAKDHLGVVYQSNWQTWYDYGPAAKSRFSLMLRAVKRFLKQLRFKIMIFIQLFRA
jgi:Family of unknown function (DUF6492)